ncbi:MAG: type II toxin-antitoxin system RelE/ParE family toxin [Planctomycetales bacterium]|nr:type II toxin-antitoxin system RelE/ParE family toxin [Planctomycetales bacterium]
MTPYSFHRLAEMELLEAAQYYDSRQTGLGTDFLDAVQATVAEVLAVPDGPPIVRGQVHRQRVPRFPYDLLFRFQADEVRIVAVAHHKRNSDYWQRRT